MPLLEILKLVPQYKVWDTPLCIKTQKNKSLRDDPNSDWAFNPLDPKTYDLQFDLYLDAIEAFPHGKYLHVGGDEVQTSGRGSGKSPLELNLIWLNKVTSFASKQIESQFFGMMYH